MSSGNFLKKHSDRIKAWIEAVDIAFVTLRIILFCGCIGWLVYSDISRDTFVNASRVFLFFAVYSFFIYAWLFLSPQRKKYIYGIALLFDLVYASLLVSVTGGFNSSFLNGFYLITALYSFYYGLIPGTIIATIASGLYFVSSGYELSLLHWTDFFVRIAFMFLLAVPLGMLSQKLKKDKSHIEVLNKDLEKYIEELRSVQEKLIQVEKLSALGRLTADVAHEIRNPLTSIGGFARRLNNKLSEGSREKEYAEIVVTEVDRLERILRDVLTFSQEKKSEMKYQEVNGILREALNTYEGACADQSVRIELDIDASLPLVLIDKDQVRLALNNLISNAIDVMPQGGVLTVKTHTEEVSHVEYIAVEVMDTGPGMPHEALNMIFEPFFTTKEIGAGTGLGLSICKKIADENNGLIYVVSELGKGTTFKMMFPHQREEDRAKIMCWEYTKCGVENAEGAVNMRCPAYPDYGRICWSIAGTFCGKKVSGAIAQKLGNCKKCDFYQRVAVKQDLQ
jgi:signal transduction histidine kinase